MSTTDPFQLWLESDLQKDSLHGRRILAAVEEGRPVSFPGNGFVLEVTPGGVTVRGLWDENLVASLSLQEAHQRIQAEL